MEIENVNCRPKLTTCVESYYINIHVYLILSLLPHFISVFFFLLFKIFFPSCISKSGGCSPNGMGGRLAVVSGCLFDQKIKIESWGCLLAEIHFTQALWMVRRSTHTQTSVGHWVKAWAFPALVQGFHNNGETLWVVYNPHRNLGGSSVCLHHSLEFCNPIYFMGRDLPLRGLLYQLFHFQTFWFKNPFSGMNYAIK